MSLRFKRADQTPARAAGIGRSPAGENIRRGVAIFRPSVYRQVRFGKKRERGHPMRVKLVNHRLEQRYSRLARGPIQGRLNVFYMVQQGRRTAVQFDKQMSPDGVQNTHLPFSQVRSVAASPKRTLYFISRQTGVKGRMIIPQEESVKRGLCCRP